MKTTLTVILLLVASNAFMTLAWYGHFRSSSRPRLVTVIVLSWLIASLEYCFQSCRPIGLVTGTSPRRN